VKLVVALLLALAVVAGCITPPPTLPPPKARRGIMPRSYKMKLAVLNFVDQTGKAGKLVQTVPDILATELFNTKRFELKERSELRQLDPTKLEDITKQYQPYVDAFLVGSITHFSSESQVMTIEIRVINAWNGTIMYASPHDVHYTTGDGSAARDDLTRIAESLLTTFPTLSGPEVKVISLSGKTIMINVGEKDGMKSGMGVLIVAHGDMVKDPVTGERLTDEVMVGEAYVVNVMPKTCQAALMDAPPPVVKIGDSVLVK